MSTDIDTCPETRAVQRNLVLLKLTGMSVRRNIPTPPRELKLTSMLVFMEPMSLNSVPLMSQRTSERLVPVRERQVKVAVPPGVDTNSPFGNMFTIII